MRIRKTHGKYVAILIGLILIFQTVAVTSGGVFAKENNSVNELTADDKRIVDEISNITGVKVEDIVKLKKEGKTWNEILEAIKKDADYKGAGDMALRNKILLQTGLGAEEVDKLIAGGYSEEEIMEAKILVERVIFQLGELQQEVEMAITPAAPGMNDEEDSWKQDIDRYNALLAKLELKKAVTVILSIKNNFNGLYDAMDEYLCSLQLDLGIEEMLTDKSKYDEKKQEKLLAVDPLSIITVSSIDSKLMDKLLAENNKEADEIMESPGFAPEVEPEPVVNDMPKLPETEIKDVKPKDPAEELMNEITAITEKSMGTERR